MSDFEENAISPEGEQPTTQPPRSPYADSPFTGYYDAHGPEPEQAKKHRPKHARACFPRIGLCLLAVVCLAAGIAIGNRSAGRSKATISGLERRIGALEAQLSRQNTPAATTPLPAGDVLTPAQVYARNVNSVVGITCEGSASANGQVIRRTVTGSGFFLSEDGYVVTNYHVVESASGISVITQDEKTWEAVLIGHDTTADMALLKIDGAGFSPVTLGSSTELAIGDMVVAIGNPLNALEATQTVGYISGKNREVSTDNNMVNMLQTDAAINSGNSGGPLFNMRGEVVGITTAKYSGSSASGVSIEGLSFAIPIDDLKQGLEDLRADGYIRSAYLGIRGMDVDSAAVELYGLPSGAYVVSVEPDGAAKAAGVQPKDIITGLGSAKITGIHSLTRALRDFRAGDTSTITVYRGGQTCTLDITLQERPRETAETSTPLDGESMPDWFRYFNGFQNTPS